MAERPIFIPVSEREGYVRRVDFEIQWAGGFAETQKRKNILSLHEAAKAAGYAPLLEVSSKSDELAGRHLSAFHLSVIGSVGKMPLECAFQGSKVFERGGPYVDLYRSEPRDAKRDTRLRDSGDLIGFNFDGAEFPLEPKTVFYDWLYLNAIFRHRDWLKNRLDGKVRYFGFTDIEFNPNRSINCQARSCALFVSLTREQKLENYLISAEAFIYAMRVNFVENNQRESRLKQSRIRLRSDVR